MGSRTNYPTPAFSSALSIACARSSSSHLSRLIVMVSGFSRRVLALNRLCLLRLIDVIIFIVARSCLTSCRVVASCSALALRSTSKSQLPALPSLLRLALASRSALTCSSRIRALGLVACFQRPCGQRFACAPTSKSLRSACLIMSCRSENKKSKPAAFSL